MKRILVVSAVASTIDQFNMENIRILRALGCEVGVACNYKQGSTYSPEKAKAFQERLVTQGIAVHQVDFIRSVYNLPSMCKAKKQLQAVVNDYGYEAIHCHTPIASVVSRLIKPDHPLKVIYTAHGFHFFKGAPVINWLCYYPVEWFCAKKTDLLLTINKEDYNFAKQKMPAKQVGHLPGVGIDADAITAFVDCRHSTRQALGMRASDVMLFSIGELNQNKNHEVVLRAMAKLEHEHLHYVVAGQGYQRELLLVLAEELGLSDRFHLLGFRDDVPKLLHAADIFCFPSLREGLPVSLMEAMAAKKPVICSDIRGNAELIQADLGGYLCDPKQSESFAIALHRLTTHPERWQAMGNYNYNVVLGYDKKQVNRLMEQYFIEVLQPPRAMTE